MDWIENGKHLVGACLSGRGLVWDLEAPDDPPIEACRHDQPLTAVAATADGPTRIPMRRRVLTARCMLCFVPGDSTMTGRRRCTLPSGFLNGAATDFKFPVVSRLIARAGPEALQCCPMSGWS